MIAAILALALVHESGVSSSRIETGGDDVRVTFTFSLEDLAALVRLDANRDGLIDPGEWTRALPAIFGYLADHYGLGIAFLGLSETDLGIFGGKGQNMFVVVPFVATSDTPSVKTFVARARAEAGADVAVSNYVMTHYNTLIAIKAAIAKAGKADKESLIDALEGLTIGSTTGPLTMGKNHHATMEMFLARTQGRDLVTVSALGEIAPDPGCK